MHLHTVNFHANKCTCNHVFIFGWLYKLKLSYNITRYYHFGKLAIIFLIICYV